MIALTLAIAATGPGILVDRVAAVVNDDVITLSEVRAAAKPLEQSEQSKADRERLYRDVLDDLIADRLLEQQIRDSEVEVTEADLDRAVQDILRQNNISEAQLEQALAARDMSVSQYREDLRTQLQRLKVIDRKVRSKINISEREVEEEYQRRVRDEEKREFVRISHIYIPSEGDPEAARAAAKAARQRVMMAGQPFEDVAKAVSKGPTAAEGGSLGELAVSGLLPGLAEAVAGLSEGELSEPVEAGPGFHIVRLEERRLQASTSFEELAPKIREQLYQREMEKQMDLWLDELEAKAAVDRRL
jgi:peptidyl-prolyl cis-trans isomerase SurA